MRTRGKETVVTTVWKDNDSKGNPATEVEYQYNVCYFDHAGLLAFLEWSETALRSFMQYEPLMKIAVRNDHAGSPSTGLYYSVHLTTTDKDLAALFKLRWNGDIV